ncbi:MAG: ribose-5-phosphate isomerase RpiA [Planctomycetota bacterium]
MNTAQDPLEAVAGKALEFIEPGQVVGLGTGRAAAAFIRKLGAKVRGGFAIRGIPTSQASEQLAREWGIPLTNFAETASIDVAVDGADEVDPDGNLIKGLGGALLREKVVASSSQKFVVLVGAEKKVVKLGDRGKLPVEIVPFAFDTCRRRIRELGLETVVRGSEGQPFVTDNGNYILDCQTRGMERPEKLEEALRGIPGVVGTGLFLGMADVVLIGHPDHVEVLQTKKAW